MKSAMPRALLLALGGTVTLLFLSACDYQVNMATQPKYGTLQSSDSFDDGAVARPLVEGVVARNGQVFTSAPPAKPIPQPPLTAALLQRGQERFNIYCAPCHGRDGFGRGMVVERGYPAPPSYHDARLRSVPDEHIYTVITNGLGKMPPYGKNVRPADRWAIVAYVRALQLSQNATLADVPADQRAALAGAPASQEAAP